MISFANIMRTVLTETMSFMDLWRNTDTGRKTRAFHVKPRSLGVTTMNEDEAWTFSYKSDPAWSTTKQRWHGYVRFLKEYAKQTDSAKDLQCMVDCNCPDYRFRHAYRNAEAGAGLTGPESWNDNNGRPPKYPSTDLGPSLCKHLVSLGEYLRTKWEPTAPEPSEVPTQAPSPPLKPEIKPSTPSIQTKVASAPEPPKTTSYYSDTRSGDLSEGKNNIYEKIEKFVRENPQFEVIYDDNE